MSFKMFENLWSDSIMYVGQSRRESACRKPSSSISIDYASQPLPQHVCVCGSCVCECVRVLWMGRFVAGWVAGGGRGWQGVWGPGCLEH